MSIHFRIFAQVSTNRKGKIMIKKLKKLTMMAIIITLPMSAMCKDRFTTHVTLTTYNAVKSQCDDTPHITADGTKIDHSKVKNGKQRIVAISRDLLWAIPLGSKVEIDGYGIYEVRDTMNSRYNHCIDILQHHSKKNFKERGIKVTLLSKPNGK